MEKILGKVMASRKKIEEEILKRAEKRGLEVDWKNLALRLLEWQSNLYPGGASSIIVKSMKSKNLEKSDNCKN